MESGSPDRALPNAWLRAHESLSRRRGASCNRCFAGVLTAQVPRSLQGHGDALAIPDLRTFGVNDAVTLAAMPGRGEATKRKWAATAAPMEQAATPAAASGFEAIYDSAVGGMLYRNGQRIV